MERKIREKIKKEKNKAKPKKLRRRRTVAVETPEEDDEPSPPQQPTVIRKYNPKKPPRRVYVIDADVLEGNAHDIKHNETIDKPPQLPPKQKPGKGVPDWAKGDPITAQLWEKLM